MEKIVNKIKPNEEADRNFEYWLSKTDNEKISAVQELREQYIKLYNKENEYNESRKRLLQMDGFPEDFIELLNKHNVKYLIVGAYALALYAEPRNTGDIDVFIERTDENATNLLKALEEFGFGSLALTVTDFISENIIVQLGVQPVRIDIITTISGVSFEEAFSTKEKKQFGKTVANFISKKFLIKNKKTSARKKDLADLELLLKKK